MAVRRSPKDINAVVMHEIWSKPGSTQSRPSRLIQSTVVSRKLVPLRTISSGREKDNVDREAELMVGGRE